MWKKPWYLFIKSMMLTMYPIRSGMKNTEINFSSRRSLTQSPCRVGTVGIALIITYFSSFSLAEILPAPWKCGLLPPTNVCITQKTVASLPVLCATFSEMQHFREDCPSYGTGTSACPAFMNAKGPESVKDRAIAKTDPGVLEDYGNGEWPLKWCPQADNGNYLEPDEIAKRHGICGDPNMVCFCPASCAFLRSSAAFVHIPPLPTVPSCMIFNVTKERRSNMDS